MRIVHKPLLTTDPHIDRERMIVIQLLKEGLRTNTHYQTSKSERDYLELLDCAEDLIAALGLSEDFHLSIWAEHRRRRAGLNGHNVDKRKRQPKKTHEKSKIKRGENY